MPTFAFGRARIAGIAWLLLSGVLASGCEAPYDPEPQLWPGDDAVAGTGGSSLPGTGGSSTGGASGGSLSSGGTAGTAVSAAGGTAGASGSGTNAGGVGSGGTSVSGGTGNLGGAGAGGVGGVGVGGFASFPSAGTGGDGGFGSAGTGGVGGTGSAGTGSVGGASNAGNGNAGGASHAGTGNAGASHAGTGNAGTGSTANCSLTVKVTTATAGGRYAPRNIGAVWVADQAGNFVRSLEVWAQRRVNFLTAWNSATSKAGAPGSRVDIVSQATLSTHVAHTATWKCQNFNGQPVPDGTYRVYFEMTDNSSTGPSRFEEFTKGSAPVTSHPSDNNNFKAIELSFTP